MSKPSAFDRELQALEAQMKKVESEYTMYFSGRTPRPPLEGRAALDRAFRRFDRVPLEGPVARFRFSTLQARHSTLTDLWDRAVRAREEGRAGPFMRPAPEAPATATRDEVVHATAIDDPGRDLDALRDLYEALMNARRDEGRGAVPFHKFAAMVKEQVHELRQRHPEDEVWFRVTRRDGKVSLAARAVRRGGRGVDS